MTNALPVLDGLTDAQIARYTERFWLKVDRSGGPEACWPFTDATLFGYGVFRVGKRKVKAHRFAYVVTYGVEPVGTLDHDCHSPEWCSLPNDADCPHRRCCNPKHVTDRSQAQNAARGNPRYRQLASAEACARGHEYTPENTHYTAEGWRQCRACSAERARLARAGTPRSVQPRKPLNRPRGLSLVGLVDWALGHNTGDGCWSWRDARPGVEGYVYVRYLDTFVGAHRLVYQVRVGPIPVGHQIDHTCHDPKVCMEGRECPHRACVNPAHLAAVLPVVNSSPERAVRASAYVDCVRGHEFTPENTYVTQKGSRMCRACASLAQSAGAHPTDWTPEPTGEARTHCRSGRHEWVDANTYTDHGVRKCRLCANEAKARYKARQKETQGT